VVFAVFLVVIAVVEAFRRVHGPTLAASILLVWPVRVPVLRWLKTREGLTNAAQGLFKAQSTWTHRLAPSSMTLRRGVAPPEPYPGRVCRPLGLACAWPILAVCAGRVALHAPPGRCRTAERKR
jgi:hypothetical protein